MPATYKAKLLVILGPVRKLRPAAAYIPTGTHKGGATECFEIIDIPVGVPIQSVLVEFAGIYNTARSCRPDCYCFDWDGIDGTVRIGEEAAS